MWGAGGGEGLTEPPGLNHQPTTQPTSAINDDAPLPSLATAIIVTVVVTTVIIIIIIVIILIILIVIIIIIIVTIGSYSF